MINVDCPWCDGPATVEVADGDAFCCDGCAIRVELVAESTAQPVGLAA